MTTSSGIIGKAASDPEQVARKAMQAPDLLQDILAGLQSEEARKRFGCAKALRLIAEQRPELLYPHFDFFVCLLDHPNKILQWEGALILSDLVRVDNQEKFAGIFEKYFSPVPGPVMITAANVIRGGARVARARPDMADRIAAEMLKVQRAKYKTAECRNVAIGHAILALGECLDLVKNRAPVIRFVRGQIANERAATRRKAEQFLKRLSAAG